MSDEEDKPKRTPFVLPKPPVLQPDIAALFKKKPSSKSPSPAPAPAPPPPPPPQQFLPPSAFQASSNPFAPKPKSVSPLPKPVSPSPVNLQNDNKNDNENENVEKEEKMEKPKSLETNELSVAKATTEIPITPIVETKQITSPAVVEISKQVEAIRVEPKAEDLPKTGGQKPNSFNDRIDMSGGLMSWITKTVTESKLLSDVAEKTKAGLENVMTTLDPGMRSYLAEQSVVELTIFNCDADIITVADESFMKTGAVVITRGIMSAYNENFPVLVLGDDKANKICKLKADSAKVTKKSAEDAAIIVMQPFLMKISERYYSTTKVYLRLGDFECDAIGQLLEVSTQIITEIQEQAKLQDLPDGHYPTSVSDAAKKLHSGSSDGTWRFGSSYPPYSSAELLSGAFISLAQQLFYYRKAKN